MKTKELTSTLACVRRELKASQKVVDALRDREKILEIEKSLPNLIKTYQGKFFKFKNGSGYSEEHWLYTYCSTVTVDGKGVFYNFETKDLNEQTYFKIEIGDHFWLCQTEILKEEFLQAYADFRFLFSSFEEVMEAL